MSNGKDFFNFITVDKPYQEPGSIEPRYIYVGSKNGKIVKLLLNNRNKNEEIVEIFESKEEGINCIDVCENYMVTGHQSGAILFWENNKIYDKAKNNSIKKDNEIICL